MYGDFTSAGTVEQNIPDLFRIIPKRGGQIKAILRRQGVQYGPGEAALVGTGLPAHHRDGSLVDTQGRVRNHELRIKLHLIAQPQADRAGAEGVIERKAPRLHLVHADAAIRTGKALAEIQIGAVHGIHHQQTFGELQHIFDRIGETLLYSFPHGQPVYDNGNRMLDIFIQFDLLGELVHIPVDLHADIAASFGLIQHLLMASLAPPHHRGQKLDAGALRQRHDLIHHLIHGLPGDDATAFRAVGNTHSGIKQPKIVINLRHRPHGGAGIAVGRFLVNGNGRRQALNAVHRRLLHLSQELSGIRGQALHISALSLRIDRIESQRTFSRSGKTRQNHHFISRYIHIQPLQIIFSGAADTDKFSLWLICRHIFLHV